MKPAYRARINRLPLGATTITMHDPKEEWVNGRLRFRVSGLTITRPPDGAVEQYGPGLVPVALTEE